jgi:hypothetical protein
MTETSGRIGDFEDDFVFSNQFVIDSELPSEGYIACLKQLGTENILCLKV